jgi:glycosyltransferase involved in cell wall biosynthesis
MKISVITISYNSSTTIKQTLKSVQKQSHPNIEHIIVDGKSTDNTLQICNDFNHISKIISESDMGVYDAFNKGLKLASGEIIGFLNSDDVFYDKHSLKKISEKFDEQTDCVFANLDYVNQKGKVVRKWRSKPYQKDAFSKGWMPAHPTFYCRKSIYDQLGGYDDSFDIAGDFELMLRFFEKNKIRSKFIDQTLVKMTPGGISNNGIASKAKIIKEEKRALQQNKISFSLFKYIFNKILRIKDFF